MEETKKIDPFEVSAIVRPTEQGNMTNRSRKLKHMWAEFTDDISQEKRYRQKTGQDKNQLLDYANDSYDDDHLRQRWYNYLRNVD